MTARYEIQVRNEDGNIIAYIDDFISLDITDVKNDVGSWTLKTHTVEQHPFELGFGIIIYRNGELYFSGPVEKVESTFNMKTRTWEWTATGKSDIALFQWRAIFPKHNSGQTYFTERFMTFYEGTPIITAINTLIADNMIFYIPHGFNYIGNVIADSDTSSALLTSDLQYRFDNLFEVVVGLMNEANFAVRPEWDSNVNKLKYHFYICGKPLESGNIFYESKGHVTGLKRILQMPSATNIITAADSDINNNLWQYYGYEGIVSTYYPCKEKYIEVNTDELSGIGYDQQGLQTLAEAQAAQYPKEVDGYEVGIKSESDAPQYQVDYKLGDTVGIAMLDGTLFTAQVTKVKTSVSYGKESIVPYIGVLDTGVFNDTLSNISNLDVSVTRILKRGQA